MEFYVIAILSYFLGSIPFGYILTKLILKKDIRKIGSGNIGATNALRTGNKLIGYLTLFFDITKAIVPVIYVKFYFPQEIYLSALCVFLGHLFPVWLKFKGGKGVASYVGILFAIKLIYGLIFGVVWLVIYFLTKFSSISSLLASLSIPIYIFLFKEQNLYFFIIMLILIIFTHRENIKRLKNKEETKTKIY